MKYVVTLAALTVVLSITMTAADVKVYLHTGTQATRSSGSPRSFTGMESHPVDYMPQILKSWSKVKDCDGVTPIVAPEGADYSATLNFDEIGLVPHTTYLIANKEGRVLASKSVTSPKNVAKDICRTVTAH